MSDIVKRLRHHAECESFCDVPSGVEISKEAADEIERLRARLEVHESGYDGISCRDETIRNQDAIIDRLRARVAELEAALRSLQVAAAEALAVVPDESSQTHAFLSTIHRHVASALADSTAEPVNEKLPAPPKVTP